MHKTYATVAVTAGKEIYMGQIETVNQEGNGTAALGTEGSEKTFTQDELNAMIGERVKREREKYADYEDLKKKAAAYDEKLESEKTELQKAEDLSKALQAKVDAYEKAAAVGQVRKKVSTETGVPESLLTADDEETCREQADAILKFAKPGAYPQVKDGGEVHRSNGSAATRDKFAEWFNENTK